MANDRYVNRDDDFLDPEDVNSEPASAADTSADTSADSAGSDVPIPLAMSPAEVEERARAVEAVRARGRARPGRDDSGMVA